VFGFYRSFNGIIAKIHSLSTINIVQNGVFRAARWFRDEPALLAAGEMGGLLQPTVNEPLREHPPGTPTPAR
jgi:hypothetical protein